MSPIRIQVIHRENATSALIDGLANLAKHAHDNGQSPLVYPQNRAFFQGNLSEPQSAKTVFNVCAFYHDKLVGYAALRSMQPWPAYLDAPESLQVLINHDKTPVDYPPIHSSSTHSPPIRSSHTHSPDIHTSHVEHARMETKVVETGHVEHTNIEQTETRAINGIVPETSALMLYNLVDAKYRGLGIGKALAHARLTLAEENGFTQLFSTVHPDNVSSQKILKQLGFRRIVQKPMFSTQLLRDLLHLSLNSH